MSSLDRLEPFRDGAVIVAPAYAETGTGDERVTGIGWVRIEPGDKQYPVWDRYLTVKGSPAPKTD